MAYGFIKTTLTAVRHFYKYTRLTDYKRLNSYILNINQNHDLEHILKELHSCLKDILDYELFGFSIKDDNFLYVWVDPYSDKLPLLDIIKEEISCQNIDHEIRYFNEGTRDNGKERRITDFKNLLSYQVTNNGCPSMLYILPKKEIIPYHHELLDILIKALGIAVENYVNIKRLETEVTIDPLTNCYNRRAMNKYIEHDIANIERYGGDLSAIMMDIDHFKYINDSYGHQIGDQVLKEISNLLTTSIRKSDYVSRYGGEEFVLILPHTKLFNAVELAEKLRKKIENHEILLGDYKRIKITASFGIATLRKGSDKTTLLREADEMLYKAKLAGRNKVMPNIKGFIPNVPAFEKAFGLIPLYELKLSRDT